MSRLASHHDLPLKEWINRDCRKSSDGRYVLKIKQENKKLSQFIGQPVSELKIVMGKPDNETKSETAHGGRDERSRCAKTSRSESTAASCRRNEKEDHDAELQQQQQQQQQRKRTIAGFVDGQH